jgi:hypothetical protein
VRSGLGIVLRVRGLVAKRTVFAGLVTTLAAVVAIAAADQGRRAASLDGRCPAAQQTLRPSPSMLRGFANSIRRQLGDAARGYQVSAVFALRTGVGRPPGLRRARYRRIAAAACGRDVALRSWVVVADLPRAPAASLGSGQVFFLARERSMWRVWYGWNPNLDEVGFPGEPAKPAPH